MISYLSGELKAIYEDRLTLLVGGIGYEVLIPSYVMNEIKRTKNEDDRLELYVSYNQTERQPKPVLVGFPTGLEKEFFELFISVEDIGPTLAIRALTKPIREIARHIEDKDSKALRSLKGIGERKAEKIIAALKGKAAKYALLPEAEAAAGAPPADFTRDVEHVLVKQLGHKPAEARRLIDEGIKRNPSISSAELLFEEVYRGLRK